MTKTRNQIFWCAIFLLISNTQIISSMECQSLQADVMFLLDASDSVGREKFEAMKRFMRNFTQLIEDKLDPMQVRLSAVTFSSHARVEFNLGECPFSKDLLGTKLYHVNDIVDPGGCIGTISFVGGGRDIATAIQKVHADVISQTRTEVTKLLLLLTSRYTKDSMDVQIQMAELRARGVHTLAIDLNTLDVHASESRTASFPPEGKPRFGTLRSVTNLLETLSALACKYETKKTKHQEKRIKRAIPDCDDFRSKRNDPGRNCAIVKLDPSYRYFDTDPDECFPEGTSTVTLEYTSGESAGSKCMYTIKVTVYRCEERPKVLEFGEVSCKGAESRVTGSNCTYTCQDGFVLRGGKSFTQCERWTKQWDSPIPFCQEVPLPDLTTCRVAVTNSQGVNTNSTTAGNLTHCRNQKNEIINSLPTQVHVTTNADMDNLLNLTDGKFGVLGIHVSLTKLSLQGSEDPVSKTVMKGNPYCNHEVDFNSPLTGGAELDCEGSITVPKPLSMQDGERFCVDIETRSGGYDDNHDNFQSLPTSKRICFLYDPSKPAHCSETAATCTSEPLTLSTRLTRSLVVTARVEGWLDPIPPGGTGEVTSKIDKYRLEVHKVDVSGPSLSVQENAVNEHTLEWEAESIAAGAPYSIDVSLPTEEPRMYALILEVIDHAGNVGYARRLLLYDNSSAVELEPSAGLTMTSANPRSGNKWQTDVSSPLCVDWRDRFYNTEIVLNDYLLPVRSDTGRAIQPVYDQTSGTLPVSGTDNVKGIVKFEMAWSLNNGSISQFQQINDLQTQSTCLTETLADGQTYDVLIRATDIMNNSKEDSVRVSIDHSEPEVLIFGLKGRLDRDVVYVHSNTDLSRMQLLAQTADPHSGLLTLQWTLGTHNLSNDLGSGAVGVQRLPNVSDCTGQAEGCYCPSVGVCELDHYLISFHSLVDQNTHQGQHHRQYYITVTATNHASLTASHSMDILLDVSPPSTGVVWEGLVDPNKAEMDFTSSDVVHVRWHGFLDHESGIMLYRVVLARRCMTGEEMDTAVNATSVEHGTAATLRFPEEGLYYTSVVAYNKAMAASGVSCSDGIMYDTSPPRLLNVSITHARIGYTLGCTQPDQPWLLNTNLTRVRLSNTSSCLHACSQNTSFPDVEHFPVSSEHVVTEEESDDLCRKLPMMTESIYITLPSDYLKVAWDGQDSERDMEDYEVGIGSDKATHSAPDLLPWTSTHGHPVYHARHSGLGHGDIFFVFLRAVNKAGLRVQLDVGPIIIDVTPPDVTQPLVVRIDGDFLLVTWDEQTFVDAEQPSDVDLVVVFRVGHEDSFLTPFLSLSDSPHGQCNNTNMTGCARYPLSSLQSHDTERGRRFFFQLHVINAAGHTAIVNTSSVRLPTRFLPSHAVVRDVLKASKVSEQPEQRTPMPVNADSAGIRNATSSPTDQTTASSINEAFGSTTEVSEDVDVILQTQELCVAWSGFTGEDEVTVEIGVGTVPDQDNAVRFTNVPATGLACVNSSALPAYTKLYSVVRASNSAGTVLFSSDGFTMVPETDLGNRLRAYTGKQCTTHDVIGHKRIGPSNLTIDLSLIADMPIHRGDTLFVELTPFVANVTFSGATVLRTTLSGYQIVTTSPHITFTLPPATTTNTSVEIMNCLKDEPLVTGFHDSMAVSWEITGRWKNLIRYFTVAVLDHTCMTTSPEGEIYKHQQCCIAESRVGSTARTKRFGGLALHDGHSYFTTVSACFDDTCVPAAASDVVEYCAEPKTVTYEKVKIIAESANSVAVEVKASVAPSTVNISTAWSRRCVYMWTVVRDRFGSIPLTDWRVGESNSSAAIEVHEQVTINGTSKGTLYVCIQPLFPWRAANPSCQVLHREAATNPAAESLHVIELPLSTFRDTDFEQYLQSERLGSKLHTLYDLDVDFVRSNTVLCAVLTNSLGRNVTWFLTTRPSVPVDGDCVSEPSCRTSRRSDTGKVTFPLAQSRFRDSNVYFICALVDARNMDSYSGVCGNGVVIDDSPPVEGTVTIGNADSGYLGSSHRVLVAWTGFSDVETTIRYFPDAITFNYSVALGSYPGGEDFVPFVSVGQRTAYTFLDIHISSGLNCIATVRAEDRVGHVTQASSHRVIIDSTPPSVRYVIVGTTTQSMYVQADELHVHWAGVEDKESGVDSVEVSISTEGGESEILPFQKVEGSSTVLTETTALHDGHSYVTLLKVTNRAGLTSLTLSKPFIVDRSPPSTGFVWNSPSNASTHFAYSTDPTSYQVYWKGFSDPHSGLAYFRVGLGTQAAMSDVIPFVYVGLQTSYTWKYEFEQGKKYFATVEACNRAGLCRVTSSNSITFDNSPPTAGYISVGPSGHHSKYLGHRSSLPVQWTGFSDPQTGLREFWRCVGLTPGSCDVISPVNTMLSREAHWAGLSLPVATPLYVTVRARNPAGLDTVSVSGSFVVDPSAPEIVSPPHFLSPRDGSRVFSQWDRSVLYLAWEFSDHESSVVRQTVYIRSLLTGRFLVEQFVLGADTKLTVTLDDEHLVANGDSHRATVVACNGADLCTTAHSDLLLIDSTPPVVGTFDSPLVWTRQNSGPATAITVTWALFADPESGVAAYYVAAGRDYDGEELSHGQVKTLHDNSTFSQRQDLEVDEDLRPGDVVFLSIVAENEVGLRSSVLRKAFEVYLDGVAGTLVLVRHSCNASYCTKECTCAPTGKVCKSTMPPCRDLSPTNSNVSGVRVILHIGRPTSPQSPTTSAKCLEGHWRLADPASLTRVLRFEWSFSLANKSAGEWVFDAATEKVWHDVGQNMTAVHCLPGRRMLQSRASYVLHVRVWVSREDRVTFVSEPVLVDNTPPQRRRGKVIMDSDALCQADLDFVTNEPHVTACWRDAFQDEESAISKYEVWVGTLPFAADYVNLTAVGLNTSWSFSTSAMEPVTRYYISVRACNTAGLQTTTVSDGVTVDTTAPSPGVAFTSRRYSHRHAQSSTTSLSASWSGFEDGESGVTSHHVTLYDERDPAVPLVPFRDVGAETAYTFDGLVLEHGHRYIVSVKSRDAVGLESQTAQSSPILVDITPPEGVFCQTFELHDVKKMVYVSMADFGYVTYSAKFSPHFSRREEIVKIKVESSRLEPGAAGYVEVEELKFPLLFKPSQEGSVTAVHEFLISPLGDNTISVVVSAASGAQITARLSLCNKSISSEDDAVSIHHVSEYAVSVCSKVRDGDSGIKSMKVGVGTTPGGLQVRPFTSVGHSGHLLVSTHVQHNVSLFAVVVAENYAGLVSRFISRPIRSDRTPPALSEIKVVVRYPDESQDSGNDVLIEAEWTAEDHESGIASCSCHLVGQPLADNVSQTTSDVIPGRCQWRLPNPHHGAEVRVTVSCENGVQIQKALTSHPEIVLLRPPDMTQAHIASLSNNELTSPYDDYDAHTRSTNTSLHFFWHGVDDPTLTQIQYRFLHESRPLNQWSPLHVYKSSAVLEKGSQRLPQGNITAQLRSVNGRGMVSGVVSASVDLDDSKPVLTGKSASVFLAPDSDELVLDWQGVFLVTKDVIYSVYAGTSANYGDVINHVTTKTTNYRGWVPGSVSTVFVSIQAVYSNGMFEFYTDEHKL